MLEFINTLDTSFKKLIEETGSAAGASKLTLSQLGYIDAVHTLGEPSLTELAEGLAITKASATVGVNRLVKQGYVLKVPSQADKRVLHVSLTDVGKKLVAAKYRTLENYVAAIHGALTTQEAEQFEATITKLVNHLRQR